ncbi:hypothetical protein F5884DRAFT_444730 [Xylogone sp. PMI_703]|nr:hypothetical protein F5884DRAFT_444730 [Xylogone sp. PMI_703]
MYICEICGRSYSSQSSLTRHSHNHHKNRQHPCLICGVTFYRKDLLSRHSQVHDNISQGDPRFGSLAHSYKRRRCHTACDGCRQSRARCDGQVPCQTCVDSWRDCSYSRASLRISEAPQNGKTISLSQLGLETQDDNFSEQFLPHHESAEGVSGAQLEQSQSTEDSNASLFTLADDFGLQRVSESELGPSSFDSAYDTAHFSEESLTADTRDDTLPLGIIDIVTSDEPFTTGWPWLHERLFLHDNTSPHPNDELLDARDSHHPSKSPPLNRFEKETAEAVRLSQMQAALFHRSNGDLGVSIPLEPEYPKNKISTESARSELVNELVRHALDREPEFDNAQSRKGYWRASSLKLFEVFSWANFQVPDPNVPILYRFVDLFKENFYPSWPVMPVFGSDPDIFHPILYLTMTSIGAMYAESAYRQYGALMHESLRRHITAPPLSCHSMSEESLWLGQSRVLIQVSALYFGHKIAFSYSQRLGGILATQARRMGLFHDLGTNIYPKISPGSYEEMLSRKMTAEARKILAYTMLKADIYTTLLLNTKPFVSVEDIELVPRCSDVIWKAISEAGEGFSSEFQHDDTAGSDLAFSNIFRIAMDKDERGPPLDSVRLKLLLLVLQVYVWKYSHDPYLLQKALATPNSVSLLSTLNESIEDKNQFYNPDYNEEPHSIYQANYSLPSVPASSAGHTSQSLEYPQLDIEGLLSALRKSKASLDSIQILSNSHQIHKDLTICCVLYHLSYVRFLAPLDFLHQISHHLMCQKPVDKEIQDFVYHWAYTDTAVLAVQHSLKLWSIIDTKSQPDTSNLKIKVNIVWSCGLFHAAVVLWTYSSTQNRCKENDHKCRFMYTAVADGKPIYLCRGATKSTLSHITQSLRLISPRCRSSFVSALVQLSQYQFPLYQFPLD